jgi:hypothetical protein
MGAAKPKISLRIDIPAKWTNVALHKPLFGTVIVHEMLTHHAGNCTTLSIISSPQIEQS